MFIFSSTDLILSCTCTPLEKAHLVLFTYRCRLQRDAFVLIDKSGSSTPICINPVVYLQSLFPPVQYVNKQTLCVFCNSILRLEVWVCQHIDAALHASQNADKKSLSPLFSPSHLVGAVESGPSEISQPLFGWIERR